MLTSSPCDGFRLAYERQGGGGQSVVLLHGWPGDHTDFRYVAPMLADHVYVVVPDLRGFGSSDKHPVDPAEGYSAAAQARSIAALIEELDLHHPVLAGYDIGSRIAQTLAQKRPELVKAVVVSPPLPGIGNRVVHAQPQREFWYQALHQLPLADDLIDGQVEAVRHYLRHFWAIGPGQSSASPMPISTTSSPPTRLQAHLQPRSRGTALVAGRSPGPSTNERRTRPIASPHQRWSCGLNMILSFLASGLIDSTSSSPTSAFSWSAVSATSCQWKAPSNS